MAHYFEVTSADSQEAERLREELLRCTFSWSVVETRLEACISVMYVSAPRGVYPWLRISQSACDRPSSPQLLQ